MQELREHRNCQSCGMPFKRDPKGGGSNADGSRSRLYCSHCFEQGSFTMPDITVNEMKQRVSEKLKEFGFPGFLTPVFTRGIPKLERWKTPRT